MTMLTEEAVNAQVEVHLTQLQLAGEPPLTEYLFPTSVLTSVHHQVLRELVVRYVEGYSPVSVVEQWMQLHAAACNAVTNPDDDVATEMYGRLLRDYGLMDRA